MSIEELLAALREIVDVADGRELTDEEASRYEALEGQLKAAKRSAEIRSRQDAYDTPVTAPVYVATAKQDNTLERAFEHYLRTGQANSDLAELRAQSVGTDSAGGYTVPEGFRNKLVEVTEQFGGVANAVENITTESGNPMSFPTVDDTANVGEIVAEGGTFASGADITFGSVTLGAYKYMAGGASNLPLRVSVELLQDSAFDVQSLVGRKLGERIARLQSQHIVNGTGSGQPKGLIHGKTGIEIAADTAGLTYDDLINFIHSVDPSYRANATWAFNDASLAMIKKMKDSHGDPLWTPCDATMATGYTEGTLLGYPVVIDQAFASFDADSNTVNWGAFGDLREGYLVRRVKEVQILVNPYNRMANGQVEFTAWARMDAAPQNASAYVALTGEA